jgi:hypothetical protein
MESKMKVTLSKNECKALLMIADDANSPNRYIFISSRGYVWATNGKTALLLSIDSNTVDQNVAVPIDVIGTAVASKAKNIMIQNEIVSTYGGVCIQLSYTSDKVQPPIERVLSPIIYRIQAGECNEKRDKYAHFDFNIMGMFSKIAGLLGKGNEPYLYMLGHLDPGLITFTKCTYALGVIMPLNEKDQGLLPEWVTRLKD